MIKEINENEFNNEVLNKDKVLVDFYANWCGPCRMLRPILEEYSNDSNINIVSINVDDSEKLSREYHISSIPCLILFKNGKELKRSVGLIDFDELKEFVDE